MEEPICALCKKTFKARSKIRIVGVIPSRYGLIQSTINFKSVGKIQKYQFYHPHCAKAQCIDPQFIITDKLTFLHHIPEYWLIVGFAAIWTYIGVGLLLKGIIFYGLVTLAIGIGPIAYMYTKKQNQKKQIEYLESKHCDFTPTANEMKTFSPNEYYNNEADV